ncbi:MAG: LURP-one-related family protein [Candidatus Nanopelagicales bacterium]
MGIFRNKDHGDDNPWRFVMKERLLAIGDDSYIENAAGLRAFWVDGKALRIRETLIFKDLQGRELYKIQERKARVRDTMKIQLPNDDTVATVKKALISPIRARFSIEVENGPDLSAKGNILNHEYKIKRDDVVIAEISKKWVRIRDTYTVDVTPGEDVMFLLAITTALDTLADPGM